MKVCRTISEMVSFVSDVKINGSIVGFVPTMGALHDGHIDIVKRCVRENDITVVSLFVNPIQFNNNEDLLKYPRTESEDLSLLLNAGCSAVFIPSVEEMYPDEETMIYDLGGLGDVMEGACRPGHFNGVAVVCHKLFNIVDPDRAYFGEKDFQQLAIIRYMVKDLGLNIEIVPHPIVRNESGLAMSSRNARLGKLDLQAASFIYQVLLVGSKLANMGKVASEIEDCCKDMFNLNPYFDLDYFEIADSNTLKSTSTLDNARFFVAAYIGGVRLIDNKYVMDRLQMQ